MRWLGWLKRAPKTTASHSAPPAAASAPTPEPNASTTTIEQDHFLLHTPFDWKQVPIDQPDGWEYRNQTLPEQMIVTVLFAREPFVGANLEQVVQMLADKRLKVLTELSKGTAVASPVKYMSGQQQLEARCAGYVEQDNVRFAWVIRAAPAKVVTVAITRNFLKEVGLPFEAYASTVFDFLQIKKPDEMMTRR